MSGDDLERAVIDEVEGSGRTPLFEGGPRTVHLALDAGESIPAHQHPGREILFHVLNGTVDLTVGEESLRLDAGELARFDGDRDISPAAVTDAEALVVLANPG